MSATPALNPAAERFGDLLKFEDLATFFGQSVRAIRPMLLKHGVPVIRVGQSEYVQVALLEERLHLVPLETLEGYAQIAAYKATQQGKTVRDHSDQVRQGTKDIPVRVVQA